MPDGPDLEDHHADGVRDDVVELARDPCPLFGHRDPRGRIPLHFGRARAHLRRLGLLGTLADGKARDPAHRELDGDEDELAGRVAGKVVDDRHRAANHDRQSDARLPQVTQVPQQECVGQPNRDKGVGVRDQ